MRGRAVIALVAAAAALALAGCAPPSQAGPASRPDGTAGAGAAESCVIGRWSLDLMDYSAGHRPPLSLSIPLRRYAIGGTYTVNIDQTFTIGYDLVIDASVHGVPITVFRRHELGMGVGRRQRDLLRRERLGLQVPPGGDPGRFRPRR